MPKWHKLHSHVWLDSRFQAHPHDVQATYGTLLALSQDDGHVAEDRDDLALLVRVPRPRLDEILAALARLGLVTALDPHVVVESQETDHRYNLSRAHGGLAARDAGVMPKGCRRDAETMPKERPASSSGSSGSSLALDPKRESAGREAKPRKPATGPAAEVTRAFEARFLAKRGVPYAFEGAKDGAAVQKLLANAGGDPGAVVARMDAFFADDFYGPKACLSMFVSAWNKVAPRPEPVYQDAMDMFRYKKASV